ncbi:unnamed protein product [Lymnaea stagnalis]|uniref:C1q domain-containing protein n=1 Tax=Lymnaea stagnalis TaxID=6523 RepID=A0AAV2IFK1_LYMST
MASKTQAQRFISFIHQQIDTLKGERKTLLEAVDEAANLVQSEVDAWVNGGLVNQTTFAQMNNRITQFIALFMAKSVEISELEINENESDPTSSANSNNSTMPKTSYTKEEAQESSMFSREETLNKSGLDTSYITTTRFAILEEAVFSIIKTTEQVQEKQDGVNKTLETLKNANLKSKTKIQERLTLLEKKSKEMSSYVDELFETKSNVDLKLRRIEEENTYANISINELNKQISSVKTRSNDALMSIQDLSKSVENTNQHYNEMSDKMNQLEISMNLMSSQCTEQFESISYLNKDKVDNLIGMVCQLMSKRLAPLETLNDTLNKKVILSKEHISKVKSIDTQLAEISVKVKHIENKFNQQTLLFNAWKIVDARHGCINVDKFTDVSTNYGSHFDQSSGKFTVPLNGFYLISVVINGITKGSCTIKCFQYVKYEEFKLEHSSQLCCVSDNSCVPCIVELKAGNKLFLQLETKVMGPIDLIRIQFSCFMIK